VLAAEVLVVVDVVNGEDVEGEDAEDEEAEGEDAGCAATDADAGEVMWGCGVGAGCGWLTRVKPKCVPCSR